MAETWEVERPIRQLFAPQAEELLVCQDLLPEVGEHDGAPAAGEVRNEQGMVPAGVAADHGSRGVSAQAVRGDPFLLETPFQLGSLRPFEAGEGELAVA